MAEAWKPINHVSLADFTKLFRIAENEGDGLYNFQAEGAVALHNRLCNDRFAYLADEVGMGKTLTALAMVNILLERKPDARILILTPRRLISEQWIERWNEFPRKFLRGYHPSLCDPYFSLPRREAFECARSSQLTDALVGSDAFLSISNIYAFRYYKSYAYRGDRSKEDVWSGWPTDSKSNAWDKYFFEWVLPYKNKKLMEIIGENGIDLLIVDEAQVLRNDFNQTNRTIGAMLGMHSDRIVEEYYHSKEYNAKDKRKCFHSSGGLGSLVDRCLFLSATPMHKNENNLYKQLAYATPVEQNSNFHEDCTKTNAYMVQRNRTYTDAKKRLFSRYFYRKLMPEHAVSDDMHAESEVFLALTQKLIRTMHRKKKNSRFEMGFMETFESYGDSFDTSSDLLQSAADSAAEVDDEPGSLQTGMTSDSSEAEKNADGSTMQKSHDNWVVATLRKTWDDVYGDKKTNAAPPHPKQNYFANQFIVKELLETETPRKAVVFVRRIKGTQQLQRIAEWANDKFLRMQIQSLGKQNSNNLWNDLYEYVRNPGRNELLRRLFSQEGTHFYRFRDRLSTTLEYTNSLVKYGAGLAPEDKPLQFLWASRAFFSTEGLVASAAFADLMVGGKVDRNHLEERTEQLAEWLPWKRTVWRIKQFFNDKLFADIRSQVLNRENMNDSDSALLRKSSPFQRAASYAYSVSSNVSTSGQQYVKKRFNSPLWPDVLVTTDIMREGVDLHLFCDRMMHYGLAWSTGDLEQRNGRCDRCNSRLERELKNTTDEEKILNAYPIRFPFVSRTVDEKQVGKILEEIRNVDQSYILKHKKRTTAEENQTNAAAAYPKPEESIRAYEKFIESAREEIEEKHKLCKQMRALLTPAKSRCFPQVSVVTNTRNRITQVENMLTGLFGQLEPFTDGWKIAMKGDRVQLSALPELGNGSQSIYMTAKPIVSNGTVQLVLVLRSRLEPLQQYKTDTAMCLQRNAEELHPGTQLSLDSNDILWAQKSLYLGQTLHETSEDFRCCLKAAELHHSLTDIAGFITKKEDYKKSTAEVKPTWERVDRVLPGNCENNLMRFKLIVNNNQWLCLSLPIRTDLVGDEHRDIWRLNHRFPEVEFRVIEGNSSVCYFHPLTDNEEDLKEEELRFMMDSVLRAAQLIDSDHAITQEEEA